MQYTVYQIVLTAAQRAAINGGDQELFNRYSDTKFAPKVAAIHAAADLYKPVAKIEAADLDEVFDIGNIGPEESITRLAPMHSVSVGDVIVDEQGRAVVVDSIGFTPIDFKAAA
jgi:hypothetical protein